MPKKLLNELKAVEIFVVRHTICHISTKSFNKICVLLISGKTTIQNELNTKSHELNDSAVFKALCSISSNKAVYELGNMTLLNHRLNASLRNYDIKQKIEGSGETKEMKTYLELLVVKEVISICQAKNEWNEQMIRQRTEALFSESISIWGAEFYGRDLSKEIVLYLVSEKCNASAIYLGEKKLMVLKRSVLSLTETPSCGVSIISQRKELFSSGKVVDRIFIEDVVFNTPSQAAACITGNARNGWKTWKDQNGTTLADLTSGKNLG